MSKGSNGELTSIIIPHVQFVPFVVVVVVVVIIIIIIIIIITIIIIIIIIELNYYFENFMLLLK
jgi:hypothetical protein